MPMHSPHKKAPDFEKLGIVFIVASFLLIYLSGDHIFNKTDNLKLALLAVCTSIGLLFLIPRKSHHPENSKPLLLTPLLALLLIPAFATLPGTFLNIEYADGAAYAWSNALIQACWCVILLKLLHRHAADHTLWLWLTIPFLYVCVIALLEAAGLNPAIRFFLNPFERLSMNDLPPYSGAASRPSSTFGHVNYFAAVLIQVTPLYIAMLLVLRKHLPTINKSEYGFIAGFIALLTGCLLLTQTRAAIVAFITALFLFFAIYLLYFTNETKGTKRSWKKFSVPTLGLVLVGFLVVYILAPDLIHRLQNLSSAHAWLPRIASYQAAINSIQNAPLFGYGMGSSYELFFQFHSPDISLLTGESSFNHVHNEWLERLQEGGFFGFTAYILMWDILYIPVLKSQSTSTCPNVIVCCRWQPQPV